MSYSPAENPSVSQVDQPRTTTSGASASTWGSAIPTTYWLIANTTASSGSGVVGVVAGGQTNALAQI